MSAQAEEVVASAATLADMAAQLDALVARFVLENSTRSEFETYRKAHRHWVNRVERMLSGDEKIDSGTLGDHTGCALGQWYYGQGRRLYGSLSAFRDIETPHSEMHAAVKVAATAHGARNMVQARSALEDVRRSSAAVIRILDALEQAVAAAAATSAGSRPKRLGRVA
jgi:hypothetical protein